MRLDRWLPHSAIEPVTDEHPPRGRSPSPKERDDNPKHPVRSIARAVTTHLRAHVAELRRLEQTSATASELEERRELVARLQGHLAGLVRTALAPPPEPPEPTSNENRAPAAFAVTTAWLNGAPAGRIEFDGELGNAVSLVVENGRVTRIYLMRNPQKLTPAGSTDRTRQEPPLMLWRPRP
jgi:hypothetical protein